MKKFRRRQFVVIPKFQLVLFIITSLTLIAFLGIFLYINFLNTRHLLELSQGLPTQEYFELSSLLERQKSFTLIAALFICIVFIIYNYLSTVLFSHRSSGAIYALHKNIKENLQADQFLPLTTRQKDFHKDVVHDYNKLIQTLKESLIKE